MFLLTYFDESLNSCFICFMNLDVWWFCTLPNSAATDNDDNDHHDDDTDLFQSSVDTALTHSGPRLGLSCTVLLESREEQRPDSHVSSDPTSSAPAFSNR